MGLGNLASDFIEDPLPLLTTLPLLNCFVKMSILSPKTNKPESLRQCQDLHLQQASQECLLACEVWDSLPQAAGAGAQSALCVRVHDGPRECLQGFPWPSLLAAAGPVLPRVPRESPSLFPCRRMHCLFKLSHANPGQSRSCIFCPLTQFTWAERVLARALGKRAKQPSARCTRDLGLWARPGGGQSRGHRGERAVPEPQR